MGKPKISKDENNLTYEGDVYRSLEVVDDSDGCRECDLADCCLRGSWTFHDVKCVPSVRKDKERIMWKHIPFIESFKKERKIKDNRSDEEKYLVSILLG
jgi:hypothetical protein